MEKIVKVKISRAHNFRKIYESDKGSAMYGATCPILSIFEARNEIDAVQDINPRTQKQSSTPSKAMHETLRDTPESFVFRNRGMTFIAQDAVWDNKTELLELTCVLDSDAESQSNGLADGGHTYDVIKDFIAAADESQQKGITAEVRLDIITGFNQKVEDITEIVESRNTSTQVRDETILNYRGVFKPIEEAVKGLPFSSEIAYYENQLKDEKNPEAGYRQLNVNSILSYLMCFDAETYNENQHPVAAYSSKKKALDWYEKRFKEDPKDVAALAKLLPTILPLRDYVEAQIPKLWNKVSGRFGDQKGVKKLKKPTTLDFSEYEVEYVIPGGFVYPLLSSFRALIVKTDRGYEFKKDPKEVFDKMNAESGKSLVYKLVNVQDKDPQTMGKNAELYDSCYGSLRGYYYESLNQK